MVRPVDMQDNLSKTPIAERVNKIQKSAPDNNQRSAEQLVQQENLQKQRAPKQTEKTDNVTIHRDQQQGNKDSKKKDDDNNKKKKQQDSGVDYSA